MNDPRVEETTPLLIDTVGQNESQPRQQQKFLRKAGDGSDDEKIPYFQVFCLCYARSTETIAFFTIFPFVNKMIVETGQVREEDVGFYAGMLESIFALVQMCSLNICMNSADRYGRRPVLMVSFAGLAISTALFGFSTKIWQMVLLRAIGGIFASFVVVARAILFDLSTPKTQARVFSFFPVAHNFGMTLGPFIGGALADPLRQSKKLPSDKQITATDDFSLFREYPYSLATLVAAGFITSAGIVTWLFIKETRPEDIDNSQDSSVTLRKVFRHRGTRAALFLYSSTMIMALGYTAVLPVFWFTDISLGGFSFPPFLISVFIAIGGVAQAIWTIFGFPPLHKKIGNVGVLRLCYLIWPIFYALNPTLNAILRGGHTTAFWAMGPLGIFIGNITSMAFSATQILLNDVAPSYQMVSFLNTVALSVIAGTRSFAPALFASLYATGVRWGILQGQFIWVVFILLTMIPLVAIFYIPRRVFESSEEEDDTCVG